MKKILGYIRKADKDFSLIQAQDKICVGVSGGKDSLMLLRALSLYRRLCPNKFEVIGVMLTMGFDGVDTSAVEAMCKEIDVPFEVIHTQIGKVVFEERKEKNPCSLCATMRRGALNEAAKQRGCNKVALGHHRDDVIETLLLSTFYEGRLHTFFPRAYLSRMDLTVIRPMVYIPEQDIICKAAQFALPIVHNPCPANGHTKRQEMKDMLSVLSQTIPDVREKLLSALRNTPQYGLWDPDRDSL